MRNTFAILFFLSFSLPNFAIEIKYHLSSGLGWIMPDGKVEKIVDSNGWVGPVYNANFSATCYPHWQAFRYWRGAGLGVGLSYWYLGHPMLGSAIAPYIHMDIPFLQLPHFQLGITPAIGVGFVTKSYANTISEDNKYISLENSNRSIGSTTNIYFPEKFYIDFPIDQSWCIGLAGGWYHFSNGSIRQPNSGYNIFAAELAVRYKPIANPTNNSSLPHTNTDSKQWSVTMAATASGRQVYYKDQQTFFVSSMHASAYWHTHPIFHLGGGIDVFYDGAYIPRTTKFEKTNLAVAKPGDCWRIGVSLQPTFVVGKFTAGFHLGAYLYDPIKELEPYKEAILSPTGRIKRPIFYKYDILKAGSAGYPDGWMYTEVVLRYHLPWHLFFQVMMKSHMTKVEFVSLGVGFYY